MNGLDMLCDVCNGGLSERLFSERFPCSRYVLAFGDASRKFSLFYIVVVFEENGLSLSLKPKIAPSTQHQS
jgi:hypothetical protein